MGGDKGGEDKGERKREVLGRSEWKRSIVNGGKKVAKGTDKEEWREGRECKVGGGGQALLGWR